MSKKIINVISKTFNDGFKCGQADGSRDAHNVHRLKGSLKNAIEFGLRELGTSKEAENLATAIEQFTSGLFRPSLEEDWPMLLGVLEKTAAFLRGDTTEQSNSVDAGQPCRLQDTCQTYQHVVKKGMSLEMPRTTD